MIAGYRGQLVSAAFLERSADAPVEPALRAWSSGFGAALGRVGPATAPRAIVETIVRPLLASLGFDAVDEIRADNEAVILHARFGERAVVVLVAPWRARLDGWWSRAVAEAWRRGAAWCLLMNGDTLRIVDSRRLYARRFAQFDLALAVDRPECLAALRLIAGAHALCADATDSVSLQASIAASDRHSAGVCRSLRDGVLAASGAVLQALVDRTRDSSGPDAADLFEQAVTIVYRILFLLFAEARSLVPLWHPVYRDSYSIEALRGAAERSIAHPGLWDALRAIARLANSGCVAGDLTVTPFNGRLFSPSRTPLAERRGLDDGAAGRAILALTTRPTPDRAGRERIVYADLGVEQLGAVYETLLDYRPHVRAETSGARRRIASLEAGSGLRKATGTFYTPQPVAEYLVRRTLAPLVRGAEPDAILRLRIVDPAMGSGAFLVAACRFLAAAYEDALIAAGDLHASDVDERERTAFRRLVAERCLYGVDLNPMAVQLARLSLWLATLAADRPLSFLDHRLMVGDSVLGAWLANLRHLQSPRGRARSSSELPLFGEELAAGAVRSALPTRFALERTPNDTPAQVHAKERSLAALASDSPLARWKRIADVWCAAWFAGSVGAALGRAFSALADRILVGRGALPDRTSIELLERADTIAAGRRFFHWELEFPEVFFDDAGRRLSRAGFDAILGNPPWEMLRADEHRSRESVAAAVRFTRDAGIYSAQSPGHANQYQLFVERALQLARPGGRVGLVLPSGLATDHGNGALRRLLFDRSDVDALVGVDNRAGIFPIHRSVRFLLVSATAGARTDALPCRFGVASAADLEPLADDRSSPLPLRVSVAALQRLSGRSLAIPLIRSDRDLAICEKAAMLFQPLGSEGGWRAHFGRELNASDDAAAFRPAGQGLPIVDGRHIEPFRAALDRSARSIAIGEAHRRLADRFMRPRLAYRDVAGADNRLTLIAAILPAGCVSTHTLFCLRTPLPSRDQLLLCGLFNSLVVNYLVRLRVTTHVTTAVVEHLPLPRRSDAPAACRRIAALTRVLSRRFDTRAFATLNARVAELYQLTRDELAHVLETFPLIERQQRDLVVAEFDR